MTPTASVRHEQLLARTRLIDYAVTVPAPSAFGFSWWHDGRGLVTEGVARRVPVAHVAEVLASIEFEGEHAAPATGPIAVGALPFDPAAGPATEMVIPTRLWTRDADGRTWLTEISGGTDITEPYHTERWGSARHLEVVSGMSENQWACAVGEALKHIGAGELDKVVLARQVTVTADAEFSIAEVVERLVAAHPGCYVFSTDGFLGASPELLVERRADTVSSRPMAGTVPRNDDRAVAWLAGSAKNRWEHSLVVDDVTARLARFCGGALRVSEPYAQPFADLAHIVTDVAGRLTSPTSSALDLALDLHPTPAVCGSPNAAALALISALETGERGCYGGPVGWVDAQGDGEFAVALRCAQVRANSAVLYAGAGIVVGSNWEDEWRETEAKLEPMLRALAPG